jgi:hypothetical protein
MNSVGEPRHMSDRHGYAMTGTGQVGINTRRITFSSTPFSFLACYFLSIRFLLFGVSVGDGGGIGDVMLVARKNLVCAF